MKIVSSSPKFLILSSSESSEITTAYRNFRMSQKISFKNFKLDVNDCAAQKSSNVVGWSYKTRFSLLDVQTFVEKKNNWDRSRIGDFQQKTFEQLEFSFLTSEKKWFYLQKIRKLIFVLWVRLSSEFWSMNVANCYLERRFCLSQDCNRAIRSLFC